MHTKRTLLLLLLLLLLLQLPLCCSPYDGLLLLPGHHLEQLQVQEGKDTQVTCGVTGLHAAVSYRCFCTRVSAACQACQSRDTAGGSPKHPRITRLAASVLRHRQVCLPHLCCCAAAAGLPGACRPGRPAQHDITPQQPSPGTTKRRTAQEIRPTGLVSVPSAPNAATDPLQKCPASVPPNPSLKNPRGAALDVLACASGRRGFGG
jgi:hypothetical protein